MPPPPPPCANPLLLEWVKEMYDLAKERNTKGVTTYKHAYDSMKACPLKFSHPSEAQQLDGIGPKICDRLTEKMKDHCEANGLPPPKKPRGKARKRLSEEDMPEDEEAAPAKKPRKARAYVPGLRTGPYAIILALSSLPEDSLQSLSKAQLIDLAQPYCGTSFTVPSEAGKFYTAWNSMRTLLDKDLVHERGRPLRKYALTDEGWQVAHRIIAAQEGDLEGQKQKKDKEQPPDGVRGEISGSKAAKISQDEAGFLDLEEDLGDEYIASNSLGQEAQPKALHDLGIGTESNASGQRLGGAPVDKYGTFSKPKEPQPKPPKPKKPEEILPNDIIDLSSSPEPPSAPDAPWASGCFTQDFRDLGSSPKPSLPSLNPKPSKPLKSLEPDSTRPKQSTPAIAPSLSTPTGLPNFDPIIIPPGTFTIRLVQDNREIHSQDHRTYISKELEKSGIKPLIRPLELGDFFWVAKLNSEHFLTQRGEEGDEIAIDWIIERKRLDDLVGSIIDGRFVEQKFRLRKSGVKNVIYIIEEHSLDSDTQEKFHERIQSSIASTQVVDGYFVKQTKNPADTIRYLTRMTRMLKSLYESKPLYLIPTPTLTTTTYLPLLTHLRTHPSHIDKSYHITYPSFASLSSKSDTLTLRDVFLKMLMCTRGISGEKALAIQKHWGTPRELMEAFGKCKSTKEREVLVEGKLGNVFGRGRVKGVLSAKVAGIWGEE